MENTPHLACVIIPTYNEAENIGPLLEAIRSLDDPQRLHMIVVDDASADGTADRVNDHASRLGGIELIARPAKLGLGTAYVAGFRRSFERGARFAITMDADFSHEPARIPTLLAAIEKQNADLAIGSRYVAGGKTTRWGIHRKILSHSANWLARRLLGLHARDCTSGFRCYRLSFLRTIDLEAIKTDGYSFLVEMLHACQGRGAKIVEIPIIFRNRERGKSKISRAEIFKAIATLRRLRQTRL
jgi:glycosyltransferase involved in cell wall biosynthesis